MDVVKQRHCSDIESGDCVSVGDHYFGEDFRTNLLNLGFKDGTIYGRVTTLTKRSRDFQFVGI